MDSCFSALIHGHCVCASRECRPPFKRVISLCSTTWLIFCISKWKQTRNKRKKRNTSQRDQPLNGSHVLRRFMTTSVFDSFAGRPQAIQPNSRPIFLGGRLSCRQDNNFNFFRFFIFSRLPRVTDNFWSQRPQRRTCMRVVAVLEWNRALTEDWADCWAAGGPPAVAARRPIR